MGNFLPGGRKVGHDRQPVLIVGDVERKIAREIIVVYDRIRGGKGLWTTYVSFNEVFRLVRPVSFSYISGYRRGKWQGLGETASSAVAIRRQGTARRCRRGDGTELRARVCTSHVWEVNFNTRVVGAR
jgi:hypothetical protein